MILRTTFAALVAFASAAAAAQLPMQAYGFEFGAPLTLAECPRGPGGAPPAAVTAPCRLSSDRSPRQGFIAFPLRDRPAHLNGDRAGYTVDDGGNLALLVVATRGAAAQEVVLRDLVAKYGEPTEAATVPLTNAYGAGIESLNATWKSDRLVVRFNGVISATSGTIVIGTPAAVEQRDEVLRRLSTAGRPL